MRKLRKISLLAVATVLALTVLFTVALVHLIGAIL